MLPFSISPIQCIEYKGIKVFSFIKRDDPNIDWLTVKSFGEEWSKFKAFSENEINNIGDDYFDIILPSLINKNSIALDVGCGTGRWSKYLSSKVKFIEAVDPSSSIFSAISLLSNTKNVRVTQASVETIPFPDESFDLVFSLGVLHHIPNTSNAVKNCVKKIKPGGFFLIYLYYNLDNRGFLYKGLFQLSSILRNIISKTSPRVKMFLCDGIACFIYAPFVLLSRIVNSVPFLKKYSKNIPLSYYTKTSWNVIRNDALDRFGTPLEQRFSKDAIEKLLKDAGLINILFSDKAPYWHAIGQKKESAVDLES